MAKVALHYYLCYNTSGTVGDEPAFDSLRTFIMEGGDPDPFFRTPRTTPAYFGLPYGPTPIGGDFVPSQWMHVVGADDTQGEVVVLVNLFVGPYYLLPPPQYLVLGRVPRPSRVSTPWVHYLTWTPDSRERGRIADRTVFQGGRPETVIGPDLDGSTSANQVFTLYK
jgi:hypothetical protein